MPTRLLARLALLLLLPAFCGSAHGHAVATHSTPADGAVLAEAPGRVRVGFNEPVSLIAAQVLDADGRELVVAAAARIRDGALEIPLPALGHGTYVASYRVVSLDGHPVGGSLVFSVGEAAARPPPRPGDGAWRALWTAVRAAANAGLLGGAGGVLFLLLVARGGAAAAGAARVAGRLALLGILSAALSLGVQGGLIAGGPLQGILGWEAWRIGLTSRFGGATLAAIAGLGLIVAGLCWPRPAGRAAALAGALLAIASFALAGHVVAAGPRWLTVPALVAHAGAVAFWVGALPPLYIALAGADAAGILRRFSALAVLAVGMLLIAGVTVAALQVRGFDALLATAYGRTLTLKLVLVAGLLALAALNKWRLTPALARGEPAAATALRRTIAAELALVAAILLATAALGTMPPPRVLAGGGPHGFDRGFDHAGAHEHRARGLSLALASADRRLTLRFASAHAGANEVEIALVGGWQARRVVFAAGNPGAGVEPIRRAAVAVRPGVWKLDALSLIPAGRWSIRVEVLVSDFEQPAFEGEVELK